MSRTLGEAGEQQELADGNRYPDPFFNRQHHCRRLWHSCLCHCCLWRSCLCHRHLIVVVFIIPIIGFVIIANVVIISVVIIIGVIIIIVVITIGVLIIIVVIIIVVIIIVDIIITTFSLGLLLLLLFWICHQHLDISTEALDY